MLEPLTLLEVAKMHFETFKTMQMKISIRSCPIPGRLVERDLATVACCQLVYGAEHQI